MQGYWVLEFNNRQEDNMKSIEFLSGGINNRIEIIVGMLKVLPKYGDRCCCKVKTETFRYIDSNRIEPMIKHVCLDCGGDIVDELF